MTFNKIFGVGLLVAVVGIGAYALTHGASPIGAKANAASLVVGDPAPDFTAETIGGQEFSLAAHKGTPVIVFSMFGGCAECVPVGQTLNQIQRTYASKGVTVVAVDILNGEATSTLALYGNYIHATFPLIPYNEPIARSYHLTAPEVTYVIGKDGAIADINQGALSYDQYKQELEKVL